MITIEVNNVNEALYEGLNWLSMIGVEETSRNGPVLVAPHPVVTIYRRPDRRVLFSPLRDANPFFHLFEAVWMLAGSNFVESVAFYASQMSQYSNDGETLRGAYGYRWRYAFGYDQLPQIIKQLKDSPDTRQAILTMWSANDLIDTDSLDKPCNMEIVFDCRGGVLNMTVMCRSNDAVWGAYGANAVHMSFLQEYVAASLGIPMGVYRQFSNNFHVYYEREDCKRLISKPGVVHKWDVKYTIHDRYRDGKVSPTPIFAGKFDQGSFLYDCEELVSTYKDPVPEKNISNTFLSKVVHPVMVAWLAHKEGDDQEAIYIVDRFCKSEDWSMACIEWLMRRIAKRVEQ